MHDTHKEEVSQPTIGVIQTDTVQQTLLESLKNTTIEQDHKDISINIKLDAQVTPSNDKKDILENVSLKNKLTITNYFDIKIEVIDKTNSSVLGTIDNVNNKISFEIALPNDWQKKNRTYYVIREHNGKIDILDTKLSDSGKSITFESDAFSTYALAFKENNINNPNTGDYISTQIMIGGISLIGMMISIYTLRKKKRFN